MVLARSLAQNAVNIGSQRSFESTPIPAHNLLSAFTLLNLEKMFRGRPIYPTGTL